MTKKEQIEEMTMLITEGARQAIEDADAIYNAGYRKASDIAREIFEEIDRMCIDTFGNFNHRVFAELKKKYTEEGK